MKFNVPASCCLTAALLISVTVACEEKAESKTELQKEKAIASEKTPTIHPKYTGTFSATVETEPTTTGMSSTEYTFSITGASVQLTTNTYHEPIRCNGIYKAVEKNHELELYYTGKEEFCDTKNPLFFLKEKGGNLYAKGLGGEGTYNDWIRLERL